MSGRLRRWRSRARGVWRLDRRDRGLAGEAVVALAVARVLVRTLPLHAVAKRATAGGGADEPGVAGDIARLLPRVARALPFRAKCLEQALAVAMMLRRRGIGSTIHLGTDRDAGAGFEAHAWLSVGGEVVVGGPVDHYREIARF